MSSVWASVVVMAIFVFQPVAHAQSGRCQLEPFKREIDLLRQRIQGVSSNVEKALSANRELATALGHDDKLYKAEAVATMIGYSALALAGSLYATAVFAVVGLETINDGDALSRVEKIAQANDIAFSKDLIWTSRAYGEEILGDATRYKSFSLRDGKLVVIANVKKNSSDLKRDLNRWRFQYMQEHYDDLASCTDTHASSLKATSEKMINRIQQGMAEGQSARALLSCNIQADLSAYTKYIGLLVVVEDLCAQADGRAAAFRRQTPPSSQPPTDHKPATPAKRKSEQGA